MSCKLKPARNVSIRKLLSGKVNYGRAFSSPLVYILSMVTPEMKKRLTFGSKYT